MLSFGLGVQEILLVLVLLFVAVPVLVIWLILTTLKRRKQAAVAGRKQCPYCAEAIQAGAQVCKFCGREQPA